MTTLNQAVRSMNRRIGEMGHNMKWTVASRAYVDRQQWRTMRAEGRCKACGGSASVRLYRDGSHDCGGTVLAMECAG
jgi:hypothetical protein